jgi:hypothetical protein
LTGGNAPWLRAASVLSWDKFKEMFPAKTASTEPAPIEASKAEVATTGFAEDGFQVVERS